MPASRCLTRDCGRGADAYYENVYPLCQAHSMTLWNILKRYPEVIERADDRDFLLAHLSGSTANALSTHLGLEPSTFLGYLASGKVRGRLLDTSPPVWQISPYEIARVIDLVRNWIPIAEAARTTGLTKQRIALRRYAEGGHLGETKLSLNKRSLVIKRSLLPHLPALFARIRAQYAKSINSVRHYLKRGETKPSAIKDLLIVSLRTVYKWLDKGVLSATKDANGHWHIPHPGLQQFLIDASQRKHGIRQRISNRASEILLRIAEARHAKSRSN